MIVLTVYSRPGCHLCEDMVAELEPLVTGRAEVEVVDISDDGELTAKYGLSIPVLEAEGQELSRYRLDRERLAQFFDRSPG